MVHQKMRAERESEAVQEIERKPVEGPATQIVRYIKENAMEGVGVHITRMAGDLDQDALQLATSLESLLESGRVHTTESGEHVMLAPEPGE